MKRDDPGDAPFQLAPRKHAIASAIREALAGVPLDPSRPPPVAHLVDTRKIDQGEVDAVVRELGLDDRIAEAVRGLKVRQFVWPGPDVAAVSRAVGQTVSQDRVNRVYHENIAPPAPRLEVSTAVREAITRAIRRLGVERLPPKVADLRPMLVRNVDQEQVNVVHAELRDR